MPRYGRLVAMTLLLVACSGSVSEPPSGTRIPLTRLRAEPYSFAYYTGIKQSERLVVRDEATWQSVWTSISGSVTPPPTVDFTKEMLIVAALGSRSTGGYSIVVDSALMTSKELIVWVGTSSPGPKCLTTQAFTSPVDIARIQRIEAPVSFVDVATVVQC